MLRLYRTRRRGVPDSESDPVSPGGGGDGDVENGRVLDDGSQRVLDDGSERVIA